MSLGFMGHKYLDIINTQCTLLGDNFGNSYKCL